MRRLVVAAAVLLLAGCSVTGAPPADVPRVGAVVKPGVPLPPARGEARLMVRTTALRDGVQTPVSLPCEASSRYVGARFTSPALILLPDFGTSAPPVTVTCRANGLEGRATSVPVLGQGRGGGGGWPMVGVSVGTGDVSGVGVGLGWSAGGRSGGTGALTVSYPDLDILVQ